MLDTHDYTVEEFWERFPDDDACLEWLRERRYPNGIECRTCGRVTTHHRVASRRSYSCSVCGHHVHPTSGTIFHGSRTPLTLWFYAIFLVQRSGGAPTAAELQRELGVTYKTAARMLRQIRTLEAVPAEPQLASEPVLEPIRPAPARARAALANGRVRRLPSRGRREYLLQGSRTKAGSGCRGGSGLSTATSSGTTRHGSAWRVGR
jgi:transposase-like zinc ribbon protein